MQPEVLFSPVPMLLPKTDNFHHEKQNTVAYNSNIIEVISMDKIQYDSYKDTI
jgi:hypothetical protein